KSASSCSISGLASLILGFSFASTRRRISYTKSIIGLLYCIEPPLEQILLQARSQPTGKTVIQPLVLRDQLVLLHALGASAAKPAPEMELKLMLGIAYSAEGQPRSAWSPLYQCSFPLPKVHLMPAAIARIFFRAPTAIIPAPTTQAAAAK